MKAFRYILAATVAAASLSSCSDDNGNALIGEGSISLKVAMNSDLQAVSRASQEDLEAELGESFLMWISRTSGDQKGVIRKYEGLSNLPESLTMGVGSYVAEAWAGDSVSASFDKRWFKGSAAFDVTAGNVTPVEINCKIANVVVSINYGAGVLDNYEDISLYVNHTRGALTFDGENTRGYFMMPTGVSELNWTFTGTRKEDKAVKTFSGTIAVQSAYEYKFNVSFVPTVPEEIHAGGALFDLAVVHQETPVYDEQVIYCAPVIDGVYNKEYFDLDETFATNSDPGKLQMYVSASSEINELILSCEDFPTLLSIGSTSFNIIGMTNSSLISIINANGLTWERSSNALKGSYNVMVTLSESLTQAMDWDKVYEISISATDDNGLQTVKTLRIKKTAAPVSLPANITDPESLSADMVSATSFTVTGQILNNTADDLYINYEDAASRALKQVKATINGTTYSAKLTGLTPGTTYQYNITYGAYTSEYATFKTEEAYQLPNAGFEDWNTSSSPYLIYAAGGQMFWDSGNHGSATMKKNVTIPDDSIKHSGQRSICLNSQFVGIGTIGKFAAGNVFIGSYLATEGTDGILGWGRQFTGRPTKLKGYVKYTPAEVAYEDRGFADLKKGDMDEGIIYMALLGDNYAKDSQYPDWPVIIKTKTKQLFDKDDANVIAYGQKIFQGATAGDGLIEFEIPFDYRSTGVRPSYIMVTAAASRGGDYFVGGASEMWLDDLELVYE